MGYCAIKLVEVDCEDPTLEKQIQARFDSLGDPKVSGIERIIEEHPSRDAEVVMVDESWALIRLRKIDGVVQLLETAGRII